MFNEPISKITDKFPAAVMSAGISVQSRLNNSTRKVKTNLIG